MVIPSLIRRLTCFYLLTISINFFKSNILVAKGQDFFDADNFIQSCVGTSNNYDWENYSFYQILGLQPLPSSTEIINDNGGKIQQKRQTKTLESRAKRRKQRSAITSKDIKKGYRSQAQLFHPDKAIHQQKNSTKGSSSSTSQQLSKEESTARFQMIAEAYDTLSDTEKRGEYDEFLLDCEDYKERQQQYHQSETKKPERSNQGTKNINPFQVFEDFFFGKSTDDNDYDDYIQQNAQGTTSSGKDYSSPRKVYETEEFRYDPYHGVEILRMIRTEEYDADQSNAKGGETHYFVRVIAQDFVKQYDPFYGYEGFSPITQPFIVEEGYRRESQPRGNNARSNHDKRRSYSHGQDGYYSSSLRKGDVLSPTSTVLTSKNGKYYAGLTPDCEFVIISDLGPDIDDDVVWSSGTYIPPSHLNIDSCFVTLQGPYLVLSLGSPEHKGRILWSSEVSSAIDDFRTEGESEPEYFARLDDDGSLAVYSQTIIPIKEQHNRHENTSKGWWSRTVSQTTKYPPRTRAAKAWVNVRRWATNKMSGRRPYNSHTASEQTMREVCIYATGLAGCNTPARRFLHLTQNMKHGMKNTMIKIDNAIDLFVETLSEGNEEDVDLLDTLQRVLGKAGTGIGSGIGHAMKKVRERLDM